MATATTYDYETAGWCNDCHRIVVMPERHACQNPLAAAKEGR